MILSLLLTLFLIICSYTDIKMKEIYFKVLLPFFLTGVIAAAVSGREAVLAALLGAAAGIALLLLSFITRGAIGEGDGLVLVVTGVFLGISENLRLLTFALFLSALFSVGAMIIKGWKRDRELPFVPFLLAAFLIIRTGGKFCI